MNTDDRDRKRLMELDKMGKMTAFDIYKAQYEEENSRYEGGWTKHHWAARRVFDLTTYDDALDELFVNDILEVCKVILNRENFEYIRDEKNYIKYILVCQMLSRFGWINWGTSIRGAWFGASYFDIPKDIVEELEWYDNERHVIKNVTFTIDNLKALIEFMEE